MSKIQSKVTNRFYSEANKTIGVSEHFQPFNHGLNSKALEYEIQVPLISNETFSITKPFDGSDKSKSQFRKEQYDLMVKYLDKSIEDLLRVKSELSASFLNWL